MMSPAIQSNGDDFVLSQTALPYLALLLDISHCGNSFLRHPATIGIIALLPLVALEYSNRRQYNENFPFDLFLLLWITLAMFSMVLLSVIRDLRNFDTRKNLPTSFIVRLAVLILIGGFGTFIIADQMPCFLGLPNCD